MRFRFRIYWTFLGLGAHPEGSQRIGAMRGPIVQRLGALLAGGGYFAPLVMFQRGKTLPALFGVEAALREHCARGVNPGGDGELRRDFNSEPKSA
jgi:hypothetical protein